MKVRTISGTAFTVVGIRIETTPLSSEIPALWPVLISRLAEIEHRAESFVTYGVMCHPDEDMKRLSYLAAVSVSGAGHVPPGMIELTIPAGTYAVFTFPLSALAAGFGDIHNRFLPASDYAQNAGPYFERYDESFDPGNPQSPIEVHLPVVLRRDG